jgi:hypothetical protein
MLQVEIDALLREGGKHTAQEMAAEETPLNAWARAAAIAAGIIGVATDYKHAQTIVTSTQGQGRQRNSLPRLAGKQPP